jgi:hypothetical protein
VSRRLNEPGRRNQNPETPASPPACACTGRRGRRRSPAITFHPPALLASQPHFPLAPQPANHILAGPLPRPSNHARRLETRENQIHRILDLGRRLLDPRGQGRAEIQGLHPPAHLHQAPLRRLRRRVEPHRCRGRLAQEGLPARQGRPQARPLLPPPRAGRSRAARLVRHPQALRQDRRRRHHPHAGHRPGKPAPAGHHRPRGLQRHHPRPARPRRRPPLQPHRGHQHQAPRARRRRGRHHRQELRIPHPQVRRGQRPERGRVLHPARGRHHHVTRARSRARHDGL